MFEKLGSFAAMPLLFFALCRPAIGASVSFKPLQTYPVGMSPVSVAMGDFNGDGKMDLAVLNTGDSTISILLGNGDGSFQPQTGCWGRYQRLRNRQCRSQWRPTRRLGYNRGHRNHCSSGPWRRHLGAPQHFDGGVSPGRIAVADFNSDGKPDLVVTNANGVGILLGNGDGSFQARVDYGIGTGLAPGQ